MKRRTLIIAVPVIAALGVLGTFAATGGQWSGDTPANDAEADAEALVLGWEDLVPADFVPPEDPLASMTPEEVDKLFDGSDESQRQLAEIDERMSYAPVDEALDGKLVTLPGYVVPLDFDGQTQLEEFLLVPYYGACIHTPPPPSNQIVMASLDSPVEIADTYVPVTLRGILRTETTRSALAETGYSMEVLEVEAYEP